MQTHATSGAAAGRAGARAHAPARVSVCTARALLSSRVCAPGARARSTVACKLVADRDASDRWAGTARVCRGSDPGRCSSGAKVAGRVRIGLVNKADDGC